MDAEKKMIRGVQAILMARAKIIVPLLLVGLYLATQTMRLDWRVGDGTLHYLRFAHNLLQSRSFALEIVPPGYVPSLSRALPPGYPLLIAAIGGVHSGVRDGIACYAERGAVCQMAFPFRPVLALQLIAALTSLWLTYRIAIELSGSREIAFLTVLLVVLGGRFWELAGQLQGYVFVGVALFSSLYCLIRAHGRRSMVWSGLAGLMLGLGALFHPPLLYLLVTLAPIVFLVWRSGERVGKSNALPAASALLIGGLVVALPWMVRNLSLFGGLTLGEDYEGLPLGQRLAFNGMTWKE